MIVFIPAVGRLIHVPFHLLRIGDQVLHAAVLEGCGIRCWEDGLDEFMNQMAPQVLSDVLVPAFSNPSTGRRCCCRYGAQSPDVSRAGAIVHQRICGSKGSWKSGFRNQVWWLLICCHPSCWNVHRVISQRGESPHLLVGRRLCWLLAGSLRLQLRLRLVHVGQSESRIGSLHGAGVYGIRVT